MKSRHEAVSPTDEINLNMMNFRDFSFRRNDKELSELFSDSSLFIYNLLPFQEYHLQQSGFLR